MKNIKKKFFSFCLTMILVGAMTIGLSNPAKSGANAELSLSPATKTVGVGETFSVNVLVDTNGQNVLGVAAYLTYNSAKLKVVSINATNSVFPMMWEETIDPNGKIKISRTKPSPGVNTASGNVATINFKALAEASPTNVVFVMTGQGASGDSDVIIVSGGKDIDILGSVKNGAYTITSAKIIPPTCVINASPASGAAPLTVSFSTTGSTDPDGTIVSNSWYFGDGSPMGGGPNVEHTYTAAGTYSATLTLTDNDGATSSCSTTITVTAPTTGPATTALIIIGILSATIYFAYKKGWVSSGKSGEKIE